VEKHLSTFAIADMLHVDPGSVANWIDQGLLAAHRTPGGHRRVTVENLVAFLRKHKMPVPEELNAGPVCVLIVDDDTAITQLIRKAIQRAHEDWDVIEASDGFRAGSILATRRPDVVLLDLRMPGMDGYEVCRMIKSQPATQNVEVLAMTAYPSPEGEQRIKECGAKLCLSKPLDMPRLLEELEAAIG